MKLVGSLTKKQILPVVTTAIAVLLIGLTLFSFLYGTLSVKNDLGATRCVEFSGETPVWVSKDAVLSVGSGAEKRTTTLDDTALDVVVYGEYIAVGYTTERKIDLFDMQLNHVNTFEVPYAVLALSLSETGLFVAVKKSQIDGSIVYLFDDLSDAASVSSVRFSNFIVDMELNAATGSVYAVARDYNIYRLFSDGGLQREQTASISYEPLAVAFSEGQLVAADVNGNIYFFEGNTVKQTLRLGVTLCAFESNATLRYAVAANISGTVFFIDCEAMSVKTSLKTITEISDIAISDGGNIYLAESRNFSLVKYAAGSIMLIATLKVIRWIAFVLAIVFTVAAMFFIVIPRLPERHKEDFDRSVVKLKKKAVKSIKSYAFILPTIILLVMFMYIPTVWSLILSFFDYVPGVYTRFVGFENFKAALTDSFFMGSIGNMLIFLVTDILKALIPAILIAEFIFALNSKKMQYWVRVLLYIPSVLPGVAVLLIWTKGVYGDSGLLNSIMALFGADKVDWLGNPSTSLFSLIMIGLPWVGQYILFYGSLMSIPPSLKDAAILEGCNWFQSMIYIDIPMIMPQMKYVFVITFINSIQDFGRIYLTTGQTEATNIPALQMYTVLNSGNGYGKAAAMGVLLFVFSFVATYINFKSQKQGGSDL